MFKNGQIFQYDKFVAVKDWERTDRDVTGCGATQRSGDANSGAPGLLPLELHWDAKCLLKDL